jgi:DNA-directed RNA polymerase II subunit RPB9
MLEAFRPASLITLPTNYGGGIPFERRKLDSGSENEHHLFTAKGKQMKFCTQCSNFLYEMVEHDNKAYLKCRACPYEEEVTKENPIVYEHDLQQDTSVQYSINPYLKYDPTLPRFKNMTCLNPTCATQGKESDIVGVKLDSVNVTWMYQCAVCDAMWKQNARS